MINNIFLVDLKDNEISDIKELCSDALVAVQGAEAQATFITVGAKEGKVQLRLNGSKSTTFMCIVSNELATSLEPLMPEIFKLRVMYLYKDFQSFKKEIGEKFLGVEEDSIEKVQEEGVLDEVDESENLFILPEIEENIDDPAYLRAKIKTLESEADIMRHEVAVLREQQEEGYHEKELALIEEIKKSLSDKEKEIVQLIDEKELRDREINLLKGKQIELGKAIKELEEENQDFESKNEELTTMVDETSSQNRKINRIVEAKDEAEKLSKELADELTNTRNGLDSAKTLLLTKEKEYSALFKKWDMLSNSNIAKLAFKSTVKASINDTIVERPFIKDCYLIGTGSAESISDVSTYIHRAIKNSVSKVLIIDLTYETYLDYVLRITSTSESNIMDYIEGRIDKIDSCLMDTGFRHVKYCRLSTGFINELSYLNLDWEKLFNNLENFRGKVILHVGYIGGAMKGVLVNSLSRFMSVQMVSRMTAINIRNTIITLGAIRDLTNLTCICIKPDSGNITPMYEKLAKKYVTRAVGSRDNISI